jgi:hypothetical protein
MTDTPKAPPDKVHFYGPLTAYLGGFSSQSMKWGDELEVTENVREMSKDRNGISWLDLVDDEDEQLRRFGKVLFRAGPWPADEPEWDPGSLEEEDAREAARVAAWKVPGDAARSAALAKVNEDFGRMKATSKTLDSRWHLGD